MMLSFVFSCQVYKNYAAWGGVRYEATGGFKRCSIAAGSVKKSKGAKKRPKIMMFYEEFGEKGLACCRYVELFFNRICKIKIDFLKKIILKLVN